MRLIVPDEVERGRIRHGALATGPMNGFNGAFVIKAPFARLRVISTDGANGDGWEHVSVSLMYRCPTWEEMDFIKRLFWNDDEVVVQYHVNNEEKVNVHPFCLHLWRLTDGEFLTPPSFLVGPREKGGSPR